MSKRKEMKPKAKTKVPPTKRVRIPTSADAFVSMPDAAADGALKVPIGGGVAFIRWGAIHRGWVHSISDTPRGTVVDVWDETEDQFYTFNMAEGVPEIKDTGSRRQVASQQKPTTTPATSSEEEPCKVEPGEDTI